MKFTPKVMWEKHVTPAWPDRDQKWYRHVWIDSFDHWMPTTSIWPWFDIYTDD